MNQRISFLLDRIARLDQPPVVMGIINATPDSFFDKSRGLGTPGFHRARELELQGADILDIGGESTRPGSRYIDAQEELDRVIPVIESIRRESDIPVSVDTRKFLVAKAALEAGADLVNDVSALEDDEQLLSYVVEHGVPVILMHKQGDPTNMQDSPEYTDVIDEVSGYLQSRAQELISRGFSKDHILLDPGIGFGKSFDHNWQLLSSLTILKEKLNPFGTGLLLGYSRKGFLGTLLASKSGEPRPVDQRMFGGLGLAVWAVQSGVRCLRTHDVGPTVDVIRVFWDLQKIR